MFTSIETVRGHEVKITLSLVADCLDNAGYNLRIEDSKIEHIVRMGQCLAEVEAGIIPHSIEIKKQLLNVKAVDATIRRVARINMVNALAQFMAEFKVKIDECDYVIGVTSDSRSKKGEFFLLKAEDCPKVWNLFDNEAHACSTYPGIILAGMALKKNRSGSQIVTIPGDRISVADADADLPDGHIYLSSEFARTKEGKMLRGTQARFMQGVNLAGKCTIVVQEGLDFDGDILLTHDAIKAGKLDPSKPVSFGVKLGRTGINVGGGSAIISLMAFIAGMDERLWKESLSRLGYNPVMLAQNAINPTLTKEQRRSAWLRLKGQVNGVEIRDEAEMVNVSSYVDGLVSAGLDPLSIHVMGGQGAQAFSETISGIITRLGVRGMTDMAVCDTRLVSGQICIPSLEEGVKVAVLRYPFRHECSFQLMTNVHLNNPPGDIAVNEGDWAFMDGDFDGDRIFVFTSPTIISMVELFHQKMVERGHIPYDYLNPNGIGHKGEKRRDGMDRFYHILADTIVNGSGINGLNIGTCTYAMIGAMVTGEWEMVREFALLMQLTVMCFKHNIVIENQQVFRDLCKQAREYAQLVPSFVRLKNRCLSNPTEEEDEETGEKTPVLEQYVQDLGNSVVYDLLGQLPGVHQAAASLFYKTGEFPFKYRGHQDFNNLRHLPYLAGIHGDGASYKKAKTIQGMVAGGNQMITLGKEEDDQEMITEGENKIKQAKQMALAYKDKQSLAGWLIALVHGFDAEDLDDLYPSGGNMTTGMLEEWSLFLINQALTLGAGKLDFKIKSNNNSFALIHCDGNHKLYNWLGFADIYLWVSDENEKKDVWMTLMHEGESMNILTTLPAEILEGQEFVQINVTAYNWSPGLRSLQIKRWFVS